MLTNSTGVVKEITEYDPYGKISRNDHLGRAEEVAWYYFTSKGFDGEVGLYYYGARYYDPGLGRFITADTIVQSPSNPQTLNRYSYCGNNPVNRIDPTGHKWSWKKFWHAAVGVVVGIVAAAIAGPAGLGLVTSTWGLGAVAGAVGGAVTGGLEGGWKGAMFGALTGGALGGLGGWGYGIAYSHQMAGQFIAGMLVAGAGVAAATDSWDSFAGGLVGTGAGMAIGKGITTAYKEQFANYRAGNGFVANRNIRTPIGQQNQGRSSAAMNVDAGSDAVNSQALSNREWKFGENIGPGGYYDENNVFRITIGENETAYVPRTLPR